MKVVIVLPTYNERENIRIVLDRLDNVSRAIPQHLFSILVVDDNSPDGTATEVQEYMQKHRNIFVLTGKKQGLGKALLRGITYAVNEMHTDVVVQMDADLSHDPNSLPEFIKAIDSGADIAIGSRYINGGSIPENWGLHRKIFSVVGNAIVRYGLGYAHVHDWTGGYRAFRAALFRYVENEMSSYSGYVFQIAFLHKLVRRDVKVVEVPIRFIDRRHGRSKIAPSEYIKNVLVYVGSERFKQVIAGSFGRFLVVGTIGFIINTLVLEIFVRLGLSPVMGSIIGAEMAIISNFILNNSWTFKSKKIRGPTVMEKFIKFNGTSVGAILIQAVTILIGIRLTEVSNYRYFYILGVGIGLIWNYFMYSRVIWK